MSSGRSQRPDLYAVGTIVGVFGIKGYLKVRPISGLQDRFRRLRDVYVGRTDADAVPEKVADVLIHRTSVLIRLDSVPDRTAAETLRGKILFVGEKDVVKPGRGSHFLHEIIGCEVVTEDGRKIGTVCDVVKFPAQDIWVVRDGEKEYMIPAVKEFIADVDIGQRRIVITPIEGLLE